MRLASDVQTKYLISLLLLCMNVSRGSDIVFGLCFMLLTQTTAAAARCYYAYRMLK
jgi:hypothetical protein